jgi:exodeoxyribonuclease-3
MLTGWQVETTESGVKIASWNVNGLRALMRKNLFLSFVTDHDPEVLCLQEIKATPDQVRLDLPSHPYQYWNSAEKKGYAGTAIFAKCQPVAVQTGMGVARHDREGRLIAAEFETCYVVSVYVPNAKRDLSRLDDRQDWDRCLLTYLKRLEAHKPIIFCGDFNVAHSEIDLARPKSNKGQHGFTEAERAGFQRFLEAGFVDTFRYVHPDEPNHYTWWRQYGGLRERNIGWRIDYVMLSKALLPRLRAALILSQVYGSDHCPVAAEVNVARIDQ